MTPKSGDIVLVELGMPRGHEQAGTRPGIVVSVSNRMVLAIPITSNTAALRFSAVHLVAPSKKNRLDADSIALVFQLRALDARYIRSRVGLIDAGDKRELNKLLGTIAHIR